jgi:YfiH family protein
VTQAGRAATLRRSGESAGTDSPLIVAVPEDPAVRVAFTGRAVDGPSGEANLSLLVGDGDVAAARRAALRLVGATPAQAVFMQQVHGGAVATVSGADTGRGVTDPATAVPAVDALVTTAADLALAVLVADCVPVVLVDPGRAVGVVHAGRAGVLAGLVDAALVRLGDDPRRVVAVIGPAVGGCCYEVPADMVSEVAMAHPAARATTTWGTPSLDLRAAVAAQLEAAGVARLQQVGSCTRCTPDVWFSHRAATAGLAPHGRQAGLVLRESPPRPRTRPFLESL